jgi:hypothetical protein
MDSNNQRMSVLYRYSFGAFSCTTILSWFFESFDHFPIAEAIISGFRGSVKKLNFVAAQISKPNWPALNVESVSLHALI